MLNLTYSQFLYGLDICVSGGTTKGISEGYIEQGHDGGGLFRGEQWLWLANCHQASTYHVGVTGKEKGDGNSALHAAQVTSGCSSMDTALNTARLGAACSSLLSSLGSLVCMNASRLMVSPFILVTF